MPCLLALFSIVTLLAARLDPRTRLLTATAAWYSKPHPTFSDTLAAVRRSFWREQGFVISRKTPDMPKLGAAVRDGIMHALCHAA